MNRDQQGHHERNRHAVENVEAVESALTYESTTQQQEPGIAAVGDQIEGFITAVEGYTADDYSIGSVMNEGRKRVTLDGLQATPGTGTCAVGDYVVTGTVVAKGTALSVPPKVCKATTQTGMYFAWRIVSLEGTGAVGLYAVIERVNG